MKDGGPAFPRAVMTPDGADIEYGMTLRDYLIAHAPIEHWTWFKPAMLCERPKYPNFEAILKGFPEHSIKTFENWRRDPSYDLEGYPELKPALDALADYHKAANVWDAEYSRQKDLQWPAFWADEMLKERERDLHGR